jgi:hypothetical protein
MHGLMDLEKIEKKNICFSQEFYSGRHACSSVTICTLIAQLMMIMLLMMTIIIIIIIIIIML